MSNSRIMMIIAGVLEAILAIPMLGGSIVIGLLYFPLLVMLIIHIVGLVLSLKEGASKCGSIVGIVTSLVAWFPVIGWIMHVLSAVLLFISAVTTKSKHIEQF